MSIGTGIVLFVVGAVLKFAISLPNSVIDLSAVGNILMVAGAVVFGLGLFFALRRKQTVTTVSSGIDSQGNNVTSHRAAGGPEGR